MARKTSKLNTAIRNAVLSKTLSQPFTVADVNAACNGLLKKSPSFLSKHRFGNPGGYNPYFKRGNEGEYYII